MKILRLSGAAFDAAVLTTRMRAIVAIDAARAVLVDGRTRVEAAKLSGLTRGRVCAAVKTIEEAYLRQPGDGDTLITVEIEAPERLARAIDVFAKSIKPGGGGGGARIERVIDALEDRKRER